MRALIARRAILEVQWGPLRGTRQVLECGQAITIGRTEKADLRIAHDRTMAGRHFSVFWDGKVCRVEDARSGAITEIDGEPRSEGTVGNGGWIRAGETVFSVYFEAHTPARRGAPLLPHDEVGRVLGMLSGQPGHVYAVLDAARDDRILQLLRESVEDYRSLYEGIRGDALSSVAPHIVSLPRESRLLLDLIREGWGRRWGIYLTSPHALLEVRSHLRRFLMVRDETTHKRLYFRFYDPTALCVLLECATTRQRSELFAKIETFVFENYEKEARVETVDGPDQHALSEASGVDLPRES